MGQIIDFDTGKKIFDHEEHRKEIIRSYNKAMNKAIADTLMEVFNITASPDLIEKYSKSLSDKYIKIEKEFRDKL